MADSPQQTSFSSTDSGSKHCKLCNSTIDKISDLPDSVLVHILSLLPTVDAVATGVLSRRWKSLWTSVPNLHFEYWPSFIERHEDQLGWSSYSRFAQFVYSFLLLRDPLSRLNKFKLDCAYCDSVHFITWVCTAIARGIQELELLLNKSPPLELPRSVFFCNTIVVLKLRGIILNVPSLVHFSSLKILYLDQVKYRDNDSIRRLFDGCPILENLFVEGRKNWSDEVRIFNISAPPLKKLTIDCMLYAYRFEINAPSLEYLTLNLNLNLNPWDYVDGDAFSIQNLSSLVEAKVDFSDGNFSVQVLRELYNVKFLSLSGHPTGDPMPPLEYASNYDLPMFPNLTRLAMDISCSYLHLLPNLLESSHNLEFLTLKLYEEIVCYGGHVCWRQLLRVPKCISLKLTAIDITGFGGLKNELKLVRYILKNAKGLNTLTIRPLERKSKGKFRVLKKISMFPRGSKTCKVAFI